MNKQKTLLKIYVIFFKIKCLKTTWIRLNWKVLNIVFLIELRLLFLIEKVLKVNMYSCNIAANVSLYMQKLTFYFFVQY